MNPRDLINRKVVFYLSSGHTLTAKVIGVITIDCGISGSSNSLYEALTATNHVHKVIIRTDRIVAFEVL